MEKDLKFLRFCKEKYSAHDFRLIEKARVFIENKLGEEKKISGRPLVDFNLDVGWILAMSGLSVEAVVSGLLYGIEEKVSFEDVLEEFGSDVAKIVFGQLQLRTIRKKNLAVQADLIRKILLSGLSDVRIVFVKLAVKLANLRIISALPAREQKRIAKDILDIYVPLASRLGLDYIRSNLEDLAFKIIHPKKYEEISHFFKETRKEREKFIKKFIEEVREELKGKVELLKIKGRNKSIRSIFKKIVDLNKSLREQKDHYAIRVIVKSEKDCYNVLGILHERYLPVEGTLKDYLGAPKPNGYQSIHTVIKTREGQEIEVQIRTQEMDEFAEEGGASHWRYKNSQGDSKFEKKVGWLRAVMESQRSSSNKEFMKNLKLDLFADKIYCYTPKGDAREMPKGSTLLDFAYSIHQEIGDRAIGGRVDGKFVSLKKILENGCVVEILTNKAQRPRRDWLKFVVSSKAKAKIRRGIRRYESIPIPRKSSIVIKKEGDFGSLVESSDFPNANFALAKCCYPLPKDELIGIQKSHRRFLVHKANCSRVGGNLKNAVLCNWKEKFNRALNLKILCRDRPGILSDLLNTISRGGFVVSGANGKIVGNGFVECAFNVIPRGLDDVCWMIERVKRVRSVEKVFFE